MNHLAATLRGEIKVCPRLQTELTPLPLLVICRLKLNTWPASFIPVNEKENQEVNLTGLLMKLPTCSSHVRENVNMKKFFFSCFSVFY